MGAELPVAAEGSGRGRAAADAEAPGRCRQRAAGSGEGAPAATEFGKCPVFGLEMRGLKLKQTPAGAAAAPGLAQERTEQSFESSCGGVLGVRERCVVTTLEAAQGTLVAVCRYLQVGPACRAQALPGRAGAEPVEVAPPRGSCRPVRVLPVRGDAALQPPLLLVEKVLSPCLWGREVLGAAVRQLCGRSLPGASLQHAARSLPG